MEYRKYEISHERTEINKKLKPWMKTFFISDSQEVYLPASLFTGWSDEELFFVASFECFQVIVDNGKIYLSEANVKKLVKELPKEKRKTINNCIDNFISKIALLDNVY